MKSRKKKRKRPLLSRKANRNDEGGGVLTKLHEIIVTNHLGHALSPAEEARIRDETVPSVEHAPFQDIRNVAAFGQCFGSNIQMAPASDIERDILGIGD